MSRLRSWFQQLPTASKLLLLLTAAILPLGLVLVAAANNGISQANQALSARAQDQGRLALRAIDSLIARNILALRVAANGAIEAGTPDPCQRVERSLRSAPGTPFNFLLSDEVGTRLCTRGDADDGERPTLLVAPGQVRVWLSQSRNRLYYRVGVIGGSATAWIDREQFRSALVSARLGTATVVLSDDRAEIQVGSSGPNENGVGLQQTIYTVEQAIAGGQLRVKADVATEQVAQVDQLIILLPLLMWIVAAVLSWLVVRVFLLAPLSRIQRAITLHEPGSGALELPDRLGSAVEIRELGNSFSRAVARIEKSEMEMAEALEGQRKLVREVHHRVKNNLQVVASLLNIHRRSAKSDDAKDAYSSIGRRVDALAVVHRNHYAELEENRGIALRPLLSELASNLRGSAPQGSHSIDITLDLESLNVIQDVAVATAFLTTEIVEHVMLTQPEALVSLTLHRTSDTVARFTLSTGTSSAPAESETEHQQFERIISGLAKQLRSTLDREPGRYSVDIPVFPPR